MSYFVAEDVVHVRVDDHAGFVSACGYEYARLAVDWADDFEPEAWPACVDCMDAVVSVEASSGAVVVSGVYALEDDAHLLVGRNGSSWMSLCGRSDPTESVNWAGHDWPEAYDACPTCASAVGDATPWFPSESDAPSCIEDASQAEWERVKSYRLWVYSDDGIEHRPRDERLREAMCGAEIRPENVRRTSPLGGPFHCHACDRAVGAARASTQPSEPARGRGPIPPMPDAGETPSAAPKRKSRRGGLKRVPARPTRQPGKNAASATKKRQKSSGADKEVLLHGRRMIVPIRFVRGGAPGLGRRR